MFWPFWCIFFIVTQINRHTKYILQTKLSPDVLSWLQRKAPNILHLPFEGSPPPTQLTNPSHKSQLSRAIDYVSSERESGVTPVEWMEGWYATPFMGAIFPCGKDIHHEMFSRLWNAWKWINRQMALHPCNRPEILLAHVFVQDIMQIRGKFQKLSFSFKVD